MCTLLWRVKEKQISQICRKVCFLPVVFSFPMSTLKAASLVPCLHWVYVSSLRCEFLASSFQTCWLHSSHGHEFSLPSGWWFHSNHGHEFRDYWLEWFRDRSQTDESVKRRNSSIHRQFHASVHCGSVLQEILCAQERIVCKAPQGGSGIAVGGRAVSVDIKGSAVTVDDISRTESHQGEEHNFSDHLDLNSGSWLMFVPVSLAFYTNFSSTPGASNVRTSGKRTCLVTNTKWWKIADVFPRLLRHDFWRCSAFETQVCYTHCVSSTTQVCRRQGAEKAKCSDLFPISRKFADLQADKNMFVPSLISHYLKTLVSILFCNWYSLKILLVAKIESNLSSGSGICVRNVL